jgi:hypothetical protein
MAVMEVLRLCITEPTTAVAVAGLLLLLVHTVHLQKDEVVALLLLQAAATGLLVQRRHKHRSAWRIQAAAEVEVKMQQVGIQERRVVLV